MLSSNALASYSSFSPRKGFEHFGLLQLTLSNPLYIPHTIQYGYSLEYKQYQITCHKNRCVAQAGKPTRLLLFAAECFNCWLCPWRANIPIVLGSEPGCTLDVGVCFENPSALVQYFSFKNKKPYTPGQWVQHTTSQMTLFWINEGLELSLFSHKKDLHYVDRVSSGKTSWEISRESVEETLGTPSSSRTVWNINCMRLLC